MLPEPESGKLHAAGGGYGPPPGGPPGPPAGGFGGGPSFGAPKLFPAGPPRMPGAGGDVNTTLPLALQARSLERQGDVDRARKKATVSTRLFVASAILGLVGYVVFFFLKPSP